MAEPTLAAVRDALETIRQHLGAGERCTVVMYEPGLVEQPRRVGIFERAGGYTADHAGLVVPFDGVPEGVTLERLTMLVEGWRQTYGRINVEIARG